MRTVTRAVTLLVLLWGAGVAHASDQPTESHSKVDDGSHAIASMNDALTYVKAKAKQAQDSRDPIKLNCVSEKTAQITALITIAQNSLDDLRNFMSAGEFEAADHELEKIMITKHKVDGYKTDADSCVGQIEVGDGKVVVIYDAAAIEHTSDPTAEAPPPPTSFRPPPASPTQ